MLESNEDNFESFQLTKEKAVIYVSICNEMKNFLKHLEEKYEGNLSSYESFVLPPALCLMAIYKTHEMKMFSKVLSKDEIDKEFFTCVRKTARTLSEIVSYPSIEKEGKC